jgi:hypothetical protein
VADLSEQVADTLIFKAIHRQIDEAAGRIVSELRRQQADDVTLMDQDSVASMLRTMADALESLRDDSEFARSEGQQDGAGGGGEAAMVPPIAELRLLRGVQQTIYDATRRYDEAGLNTASDADRNRLLELSTRQRELATLGELLIEQMEQPAP